MKFDVANEYEPYLEVLDPLRIQIVVDHLCLAVILPSGVLQIGLPGSESADGIRYREEVQVD